MWLVETVQFVWCVVAAKGHVPVVMVEVVSSCMSVSCQVDECRHTVTVLVVQSFSSSAVGIVLSFACLSQRILYMQD